MLPSLPKFKSSYSSPTSSSQLKTLSLLLQSHLPTSHLHQIHARIFRIHADQDNLIATRLIGHYPPPLALRVFYHLQNPNIFPSNAIIRILSENGLMTQVFSVFKTLKTQSLSPNDLTFSFLFKACFRATDVRIIQQIHTHVVRLGFDCNSSVCNGLIAVYAKGMRDVLSAHKLFDEMPQKSMIFPWTCLIAGYAQLNRTEEVLTLFLRMVGENLMPEDDTMVSILSACSNLEIKEIERWVRVLSEFGSQDEEVDDCCCDSVDTVLVYLYGKWGQIEKSKEVFDKITKRGGARRCVLLWNAMIGCYAQNSRPIEALSLFQLMVASPTPRPNHVTMVNVLSSCAQVGDLELGRWVHKYMKNRRSKSLVETNTILATAFIDMYSKCGDLDRAVEVFDQMVTKDLVTFNAMIMGFAINGEGEEALRLFTKMEQINIHPNTSTFLGILSACNHSGLVDEGHRIFREMGQKYSVLPELEHYSCYIDLLARVGRIEEALEVVNSMAIEPNSLVWGALLGGCLANSRFDVAEDIARRVVKADQDNSGGYVMLSNLFAKDRRWSEILKLRGMMKERGVRKQPGCSWISIDGVVYEFLVGSTSHPQSQKIFCTLHRLFNEMRSLGY